MRIPGRAWIVIHRTQNRWHDLLAVLTGYCNDRSTKTSVPGEGGYTHWRCDLRRRHDGLHRYRNYVWDQEGQTEYAPLQSCPSQPWDRNGTPTMRQMRHLRRWHQEQSEKRAEARRARGEAY